MANLSDYMEQKIINWLLRATAMGTAPANVYIALFTAAPSDSGGGTEVTGGSYARATVSTTGSFGAPAAAGLTDNLADITFPAPTANWGTVTHIGIFDALTAGNLLLHGVLTTSKVINSGDQAPKIALGALDITLA